MSWKHLEPLSRPARCASNVVEFSVTMPTGHLPAVKEHIGMLTIRTLLMEHPPEFLKHGNRFKALIGDGQHAGQIRIEPGADYLVGRSGGPVSKGIFCLRFRRPEFVKAEKCRCSVEFDYGDNWLEVTLPSWIFVDVAPVPTKAPLALSATAITEKKPFTSAIADVKHDFRRGA